LALPDIIKYYGPVRATVGIPAALVKYFAGELTRARLVSLINMGKIENREALDQAGQASP